MCGIFEIAAFIGPNVCVSLDFLGLPWSLALQLVEQRGLAPGPWPHFQPSAAEPGPEEADFQRASIVPTTWELPQPQSPDVTRDTHRGCGSSCPVFPDSKCQPWGMISGFLSGCSQGPGAPPGRTGALIEAKAPGENQRRKPAGRCLLLSSSDIVLRCCGQGRGRWRSSLVRRGKQPCFLF